MCRQGQTFYRCNCSPPPPILILCEARCRNILGRVFTWTANLCQACTYRQRLLQWFCDCWTYRRTGGVAPGLAPSQYALKTAQWLQNSGEGPRLEQQMAAMQRDTMARGMARAKMLTVDEMLNPVDEQAVVRASVDKPSVGRVPSVEQMQKERLDSNNGTFAVAGKAGLFPTRHERPLPGLEGEAIRRAVIGEKYRKARSPTMRRFAVHKKRR